MDVTVLIVAMSSLTVLIVSTVLVFHPDYEDGLVGRLALGLMAMASYVRFAELLEDNFTHRPFGTVAVVLWFGLALFMARHLYRFLRWRRDGDCDWRPARKH